ncbi:hypothetical protein RRG08_020577 [Elysia crispata]|uniref:Uncharacterized protein n=1 Tax=Elysia crispata TaxID=231223 RepID=A0AAE1A7G4_9GAST|nr:hypothetical protein RRG08_020577 [Elysia crispata]
MRGIGEGWSWPCALERVNLALISFPRLLSQRRAVSTRHCPAWLTTGQLEGNKKQGEVAVPAVTDDTQSKVVTSRTLRLSPLILGHYSVSPSRQQGECFNLKPPVVFESGYPL